MNIFTKENFAKYNTKGRTWGIGNWTTRNGVSAMVVTPEPFYQNNYRSDVDSGMLFDEFAPNTRYIFDFWIDYDAIVYESINRAGGFRIFFTDGTYSDACVGTGGNLGFQRKFYITPAGKSVRNIDIYYWTNADVFYRYDCSISPYSETAINKNGNVQSNIFKTNSADAKFYNGGVVQVLDVIEN